MTFGVGQVINERYKIQRELGRGGMGLVFQAFDVKLSRTVAIKRQHGGRGLEGAARFMREARAAARLVNQHTTRVLDVASTEQGEPYIVMEHLVGENLRGYLRRAGAMPSKLAVRYLAQACEGIAEAHQIGLVHRDIKPPNIFLAQMPDGEIIVKLLDFGISKGISGGMTGPGLTKGSALLGSPRYLSPESLRSSKLTGPSADIWSLGTVLYELLTGKPAFSAATTPALMALIVSTRAPDIRRLRPEMPAQLASIVARCLEPNIARRWSDASQLRLALAHSLTTAPNEPALGATLAATPVSRRQIVSSESPSKVVKRPSWSAHTNSGVVSAANKGGPSVWTTRGSSALKVGGAVCLAASSLWLVLWWQRLAEELPPTQIEVHMLQGTPLPHSAGGQSIEKLSASATPTTGVKPPQLKTSANHDGWGAGVVSVESLPRSPLTTPVKTKRRVAEPGRHRTQKTAKTKALQTTQTAPTSARTRERALPVRANEREDLFDDID